MTNETPNYGRADRAEIILLKHPLFDAQAFKKLRHPHLVRQNSDWFDYDPAKGFYPKIEYGTIGSEMQKFLEAAKTKMLVHVPVRDEDGVPKKDDKGKPITELQEVSQPYCPVPSNVNQAVEMLGNDVHQPFNVNRPPCWLRGPHQDKSPSDIIAVANGLLYYPTRELLAHTPDFFCLQVLPIKFDAHAKCPLWTKFVYEIMRGRSALIDGLQEALGYSLSSNRNLQRIFFLKGVPGSGKGTWLRVLQALHGAGNFSNPTIRDLDEKYGLEGSIDKAAMIVTDMTPKMSAMDCAAEFLKGVSGQDNREVRRMAKVAWQGVIVAQIWMAAVTMPNFGISAEELNRRLLVWPFDVRFQNEPSFDPDLTAKLLLELPGILNWALDGYERLMKRNRFVESAESIKAKAQLLALSDPIQAFAMARCEVAADAWIDQALLNQVYQEWSDANCTHTLSARTFRSRLTDAFQPTVQYDAPRRRVAYSPTGQPLPPGARRKIDVVLGIRLNAEWHDRVYRRDDFDPAAALDETGAPIPLTADERPGDFEPGGDPVIDPDTMVGSGQTVH